MLAAGTAAVHDFDDDDDRSEASGFSDEAVDSSENDSGADGSVEASLSDSGGSDGAAGDSGGGQAAFGAVPNAAPGNEGGAAAAPTAPGGPFKSTGKGAAIAKAFAKATRGPRDASGATILSGSKSVLKRQREEAASEAVDKQARLLRQEMRRRGHVKVPKRGEDPEHDAAEKALLRTARRGVVRLFNAVSKAQKQNTEQQAVGVRAKAQQLTKADFLAELRGKPNSAATQKPAPGTVGISAAEQAAAQDQPAWEPLQDAEDFSSLQSGLRMKDWDKQDTQTAIPAEIVTDVGWDSDSD